MYQDHWHAVVSHFIKPVIVPADPDPIVVPVIPGCDPVIPGVIEVTPVIPGVDPVNPVVPCVDPVIPVIPGPTDPE